MTNSVIYCFSATGNSLSAARRIASRLDAKVIPITKETSLDCSADQIGLVFPDYFMGIPKIVSDFLVKISIQQKDPYMYAVITYGDSPGGALNLVQSILSKRSLHLSYGKTIKMVENYIPMYEVKPENPSDILHKADIVCDEIASSVLYGQRITIKLVVFFISKIVYSMYLKKTGEGDCNFVVEESCTGCGICASVCPQKNITIADKKPVFNHDCTHCLACMHWCPSESIQYGKKSKMHKRYHHPEITLKDMSL